MLTNCARFIETLQRGGPWKSYAEIMDWLRWAWIELCTHNSDAGFVSDENRLTEIYDYLKLWEGRK